MNNKVIDCLMTDDTSVKDYFSILPALIPSPCRLKLCFTNSAKKKQPKSIKANSKRLLSAIFLKMRLSQNQEVAFSMPANVLQLFCV